MARIHISPEQLIVFRCSLGFNHGCNQIDILAQYAAEAFTQVEIINWHAGGRAGTAAIAGWPIGNVLAAAETTLRELAVERARIIAHKMGENLALLLPRQIGAGACIGDEELRKIPFLDAHAKIICLCRASRKPHWQ